MTDPIIDCDKEPLVEHTMPVGYPSVIGERLTELFYLLDRIDTQIDMCNNALNAAQVPASGKLGIARDAPVHDGMAGYPRLVQYRRIYKMWRYKAVGNNNLSRRAKSRPPFTKSQNIVKTILIEADKLFRMRAVIVEKMANLMRYLATTKTLVDKVEDSESVVYTLMVDARKILESDFEIDDADLGY